MADLKTLGRQIGQPSAPDISAAGKAAGGLANAFGAFTKQAVALIEYNEKLDASFVNSEYSQALNNAYLDASQPASIGAIKDGFTAVDRYAQESQQLISDGVNSVPKSMQSELRFSLQNTANSNLLKIKSAVQNDLYKKHVATIEQGINAEVKNIYNAIAEGNTFNAVQSEKHAYDFIRQARAANFLDDKSEAHLVDLIRQTKLEAKYTRMGQDAALGRPGTISKITEWLAQTKDGLSQSEYEESVQAFTRSAQRAEALTSGERQKRANEQKTLITEALIKLEEAKKFGTEKEQDEARDTYLKLVEGARSEEYITPQEAVSIEHEAKEGLIQHRTKKEVERLQSEIAKKEEALKQFSIGGHQEKARAIQEEIKGLLGRLKNLNAITEADAFKEVLKIRDIDFSSRYLQRGINDALASPGTPEAQLVEFAKEGLIEPEMTEVDKLNAINSYVSGVNFANGLTERQRAVNAAEVSNRINDGTITNTGQIGAYDLTALQQKQAEGQLIKKQTKVNAKEARLTDSLKKIQAGGGAQNRIEPNDKESVFGEMVNAMQEVRKEQTGDLNYQLTRNDVLQVYKEMNTSVPHLTSRLDYAILQANPEKEVALIQDALATMRELSDYPNVLKDINEKTRSAAMKINSALLHGQDLDMMNLVEKARDMVNPKDPESDARSKRFSNLSNKEIESLYKSVLPGDPKKNIETYGQFNNLLGLYNMTSDSIADAAKAVGEVMSPTYGEDKFFEPNSVGYLPSKSTVPYSEIGHWYTNQIYLSLYGLTERHKSAENISVNDKLKWVYPDPQETVSEEKLYKDNMLALGDAARADAPIRRAGKIPLQAQWRGEIVDVYYMADSLSRINDNEKPKYVFYIKQKNGEKYFINDPKSKDGSGFYVEYPQSLSEFLPNYFDSQEADTFEERTRNIYHAERAKEPGTYKGTLKELKEQKAQEMKKIATAVKKHKVIPEIKTKKGSKVSLADRLLRDKND